MQTNLQRFRFLQHRLSSATYSAPRLLIVTGARQTGKTTLARATYPDLRYLNLDAIELREVVRAVRSDSWGGVIGPAVIDEAQKEPMVFDKVKYAFDAGQISQTVLLGSSQILMLQKVRETLAGRAFVYELWPLMASELACAADKLPEMPLLDRLLVEEGRADDIFSAVSPIWLGDQAQQGTAVLEHLVQWGGMPALLPLTDDERRKWLQSYDAAYLERDLGDLARLNDLMPFRQFQRLCALRSGQLLSYAQLGRDAGVSATTASRYIEYLRLSYQAFLLAPYATNLTSTIVKSPKVYWADIGLWRQQIRYEGPLTGQLFETLVVTEIFKWIKSNERNADLNFYRTRSGLEVDLLLSTPSGVWGVEIKSAKRLGSADFRGLREVAEALGETWRGGVVVYTGATIEKLTNHIWAVPVERLLV